MWISVPAPVLWFWELVDNIEKAELVIFCFTSANRQEDFSRPVTLVILPALIALISFS